MLVADSEVPVGEQSGRQEGPRRQEELHQEDVERQAGDAGPQHDLARAEPVQRLPSVEHHHLERADRQAQRTEADPVELRRSGRRALAQEGQQADRCDDAERHVDVEHPAPAVVVGEPTAQDRAADRPHHHARGPQAHRLGTLLGRRGPSAASVRARGRDGSAAARRPRSAHRAAPLPPRASDHAAEAVAQVAVRLGHGPLVG